MALTEKLNLLNLPEEEKKKAYKFYADLALVSDEQLNDNVTYLKAQGVEIAKARDIKVLCNSKEELAKKFSILHEIGETDIFVQNPKLLNHNVIDIYKRINYCKQENIEYKDENGYKNFLFSEDKFKELYNKKDEVKEEKIEVPDITLEKVEEPKVEVEPPVVEETVEEAVAQDTTEEVKEETPQVEEVTEEVKEEENAPEEKVEEPPVEEVKEESPVTEEKEEPKEEVQEEKVEITPDDKDVYEQLNGDATIPNIDFSSIFEEPEEKTIDIQPVKEDINLDDFITINEDIKDLEAKTTSFADIKNEVNRSELKDELEKELAKLEELKSKTEEEISFQDIEPESYGMGRAA